MLIFSRPKKRFLFLWTLLLSMAMLCAQGVKFHVHDIQHEHDQQHNHFTAEENHEHSHLNAFHLVSDVSHADLHDELISVHDTSPDSLFVKISIGTVIALIAIALSVFYPRFYHSAFYRRHEQVDIFSQQYLFSPPLRAPPF